jgi:pimeloyl-ACP methyl ester carboxylesterase
MNGDWEVREAGPATASHTVLLLPGGLCGAGSWAEVMAEPALAAYRLVAVTLPGHAGAPPPEDFSVEGTARQVADLARALEVDVVVGFSMGASVALEMVASRGFDAPVVLLGISLSAADEPAFFRGIVRLGGVLGTLPAAALARMASAMVMRAPLPEERRAALRDDLRRNVPADTRASLRAYLDFLHRHEKPAERLCRADVPTWVVHAEKGDGGLTSEERRTLAACPWVHLVTVPGSVFLLPNEVPDLVADLVVHAVDQIL